MGNAIRMGEGIRGRRLLAGWLKRKKQQAAAAAAAVIIFALFCPLTHLDHLVSSRLVILYFHPPAPSRPYNTNLDPSSSSSVLPSLPLLPPAQLQTPAPAYLCPRIPNQPPHPTDRQTDRHAPIAFLTSPPHHPLSSCKQASRYRTRSPVDPPLPPNRPPGLPLSPPPAGCFKEWIDPRPPSLYPAVVSTLPPSSSKQLVQPPAIARLQLLSPLLLPTASVALAAAPGVRALHYSPRQTEPDTSCAAAPLPPNRRLYSSR